MSTMPHNIWPRMIAKIPAMTRTTARIHSSVTMVCSPHSWRRTAPGTDASDHHAASRPEDRLSPRSGSEGGVAVAQQLGAARLLVDLTDRLGGLRQHRHAAQEPAVGLVRPRHRAEALPPVAAQRVQAAVVAGAGVGVGLDRV